MMSVTVDPRIELLTAVQLFTSWSRRGIWRESYRYKEEMIRSFESHRYLDAVRLFEQLFQKGFSFDAPVGFMMHLSDPPELGITKSFSTYHIQRARDANILKEFVDALREYSSKSDFSTFWREHLTFYKTVEHKASLDLEMHSAIKLIEEYFEGNLTDTSSF